MNAPLPTAALDLVVELLPLTALCISPTDIQAERRASYNPLALTELAASIAAQGVLQPILVRPLASHSVGRTHEIVAGERRYLAAERAGLGHIPARILGMSDVQVLQAQLVENIQREALDALAEARGYRELVDSGVPVDALVSIVGKSRSQIYGTLQLLTLGAEARAALAAGEIDRSKALLLAAIRDPKRQTKALALVLNQHYSVRDLEGFLGKGEFGQDLKAAPFDLTDTSLPLCDTKRLRKLGAITFADPPLAPACHACDYYRGNHHPDAANPDVCTLPTCYEGKVKAFHLFRASTLRAAGTKILDGEAARAIIPAKGKLVGHVDLDETIDELGVLQDDYSYPELQEGESDDAFEAREQAHAQAEEKRGATRVRELLGTELRSAYVQDPHTGHVREVVSIKQAKAALAKHGVDLYDKREPERTPSSPVEKVNYAAQHKAEEERREKERAYRRRVFDAVSAKATGPLVREDLIAIAGELTGESWVRKPLKALGLDADNLARLKDNQLAHLIRMFLVRQSVTGLEPPSPLFALAKRYRVDLAALKKEPGEKPAAAPKAKAKPAAKAKGRGKRK